MRIEYRREGGFTGLPLAASVDTSRAGAEGLELEHAVRNAGLLDDVPPPPPPRQHARPDAFVHMITVEDGTRRCDITVADPVPPTLAPLIALLRAAGQRAR